MGRTRSPPIPWRSPPKIRFLNLMFRTGIWSVQCPWEFFISNLVAFWDRQSLYMIYSVTTHAWLTLTASCPHCSLICVLVTLPNPNSAIYNPMCTWVICSLCLYSVQASWLFTWTWFVDYWCEVWQCKHCFLVHALPATLLIDLLDFFGPTQDGYRPNPTWRRISHKIQVVAEETIVITKFVEFNKNSIWGTQIWN